MTLTGSAPVAPMEEFSEKKNTVTFNKPHADESLLCGQKETQLPQTQMWILSSKSRCVRVCHTATCRVCTGSLQTHTCTRKSIFFQLNHKGQTQKRRGD